MVTPNSRSYAAIRAKCSGAIALKEAHCAGEPKMQLKHDTRVQQVQDTRQAVLATGEKDYKAVVAGKVGDRLLRRR